MPLAAPAVVGANVMVNDVVCPGFRLAGAVQPVRVKPVPVMACAVMEMADVPVFDTVTGTDPLEPTARLLKLMLAGFAASAPCVPVPLRGMVSVVFVAVDVITMFAETAPVVVGANVAVNDALAPAAIVWFAATPLVLKPDPVVLT